MLLFLVLTKGPSLLSQARTYEIQFHTVNLTGKLDYQRWKNVGISRIIFRVFQDEPIDGGLYFINTQFRTLSPALEKLIDEFDYKKLDLFAWMISRKFCWLDNKRLFDYQYQDGQRQVVPKLDIFNPDATQKMITAYKELASHRIKGILIQDDLTLRFNEGFSNWGKAQFSRFTHVPARENLMIEKNSPYYASWKRVKIDQVNHIVSLIVSNCKQVNSGITIGMNVYYETPIFTERAEDWYSHNLQQLADSGLDYIYLMAYHRQMKKEMNLDEFHNRELFKKMIICAYATCKEKLVVKLQIRDWDSGQLIPEEELRTYLDLIPPQVERVCFTPVMITDIDYIGKLVKTPVVKNDENQGF